MSHCVQFVLGDCSLLTQKNITIIISQQIECYFTQNYQRTDQLLDLCASAPQITSVTPRVTQNI